MLVAGGRYERALAHPDAEAVLDPETKAWVLFRLGCYRSTLALGLDPTTLRGAVAVAASLAACGEGARAEAVWRAGGAARRLDRRWRREAARALAPFHPRLAAEIAEGLPGDDALRAALDLATGHRETAAARLATALARAPREPDVYLLAANVATVVAERWRLLNAHLAAQGLSPVFAATPGEGPSALGLRGTAHPARRGPLVSVIMPARDTAGRIGAAIDSLLAQSWRDLEILVVDDASEDDTAAVAAARAQADPRVRVLRQSASGGPYLARNRALGEARGEFVTCHDSDDWAHPERIERQVAALLADGRLAMTTSNWVRVTDDGQFCARPVYPLSRRNPASPMLRRETFDRIGPWDAVRTGADTEFFARARALLGRGSHRHFKLTLTIGAHREGSLMTDPATGMGSGPMNPERLAYWETWRRRHIGAASVRGAATGATSS